MKKTALILLTTVLLAACGSKNAGPSTTGVSHSRTIYTDYPPFPYQDLVDQYENIDSEFMVIGDDGDGFQPICDKIHYPSRPEFLKFNSVADSLLQMYNTTLAFNAIAADIRSAIRLDATEAFAESLRSVNLEGIEYEDMRDAVKGVADKAAYWLEQGEDPDDHEIEEIATYYDTFDRYFDDIIDRNYEKDAYFEPGEYIDYPEVHEKALRGDSLEVKELALQALNAIDFTEACCLAKEYAIAAYDYFFDNGRDQIALFYNLLERDDFSPILNDILYIWRSMVQRDFGGLGNYSPIYNLFYNDMRNRVALKYITHLNHNPDDRLAFKKFLQVVFVWNVVRDHSPYGNSILDDMASIYEDILSQE